MIDLKIAEHGGHVVRTTEHGLLLAFPWAVDAARRAIEALRCVRERNAGLTVDQRMVFRVTF